MTPTTTEEFFRVRCSIPLQVNSLFVTAGKTETNAYFASMAKLPEFVWLSCLN